jgi:phosphoribosyl-ATP pyrophosphohydrolase
MSKWHKRVIIQGKLGELSKVEEELEEAFDAEERGQTLMLLFELSDIIGACGLVAAKYGLSLDDLVKFSKLRSEVAKNG